MANLATGFGLQKYHSKRAEAYLSQGISTYATAVAVGNAVLYSSGLIQNCTADSQAAGVVEAVLSLDTADRSTMGRSVGVGAASTRRRVIYDPASQGTLLIRVIDATTTVGNSYGYDIVAADTNFGRSRWRLDQSNGSATSLTVLTLPVSGVDFTIPWGLPNDPATGEIVEVKVTTPAE
jgi:hypothetical protein